MAIPTHTVFIEEKLRGGLRAKLVLWLLQYCKNIVCIEFEDASLCISNREFCSELTTVVSELSISPRIMHPNYHSGIKQLVFRNGSYPSLYWLMAALRDPHEMLRIGHVTCTKKKRMKYCTPLKQE